MEGSLHFNVSQVDIAHSWKKIYVSNLQEVFTETLREYVDISNMQPQKYYVYTMSVCTKEIKAKGEEELGKQQ